jgi:hypothetical protein
VIAFVAFALATAILAFGLILTKPVFIRLAEDTLVLLDSMVGDFEDELHQQKLLMGGVAQLLKSLLFFLLCLIASVLAALGLFEALSHFLPSLQVIALSDWQAWTGMLIGGVIPFLIPMPGEKKGDYSDWSKLLHRIALDNYHIAEQLFEVERKRLRKRGHNPKSNFLVVTGLARAGTTAMTTQLHSSGRFHSLSYANMPFLMSPNIWAMFYNPEKGQLKERSHGDKVMVGTTSVEALEEFFFKVFLGDSYIDEKSVHEHSVDERVATAYLDYQTFLSGSSYGETIYLAKNNNWLTRYRSMRSHNSDFHVLLMFRDPLQHALSLQRQHSNFTARQEADPFVLEYMDWLGHHEFGRHAKTFHFNGGKRLDAGAYPREDINHWLAVWVNYYSYVLELPEDPNLTFIEYEDFKSKPNEVFRSISRQLKIYLALQNEAFRNEPLETFIADDNLHREALKIFARLKEQKLIPLGE